VTDGGFRPDGTFVRWPGWPAYDSAALSEAFRRAVLRLFVRRGFFDEDQAEGMLQWPHSGFHVHAGVGVSEDDRPFALRLARYCARNPLALDRLTYEPATEQLTYRSDKTDGPTAGTQTLDPLEFLARLLTHIPDPGQVMTRYYGWYASRTRGTRARLVSDGRRLTADGLSVEGPVAITEAVNWSLRAARYRWAELLRRIYEVDPLACPRCAAPMRIVAVITDPAVITRILVHRARCAERALLPAPSSLLPAPGPIGVSAAQHRARAARFSTQPRPVPGPTRSVIDAPTTRPDVRIGRIGTKGSPSGCKCVESRGGRYVHNRDSGNRW